MARKADSFKEEIARFLEEPSRELFRSLLQSHYGELPQLDFKAEWPEQSKLVKHVLALGNSGGGCLVMGVRESTDKTLEPSGLSKLTDKTEIDKSLRKFVPQALADKLLVMDFSYTASEYPALLGKSFQVMLVQDDPENLPFLAVAETTGLRRTAVYTRRMASTEEANHDELQSILNRRILTGHSTQHTIDLGKHLEDLKVLYGQLQQFHRTHPFNDIGRSFDRSMGILTSPNPRYPRESYEEFIVRMIETKKRVIAREIS